MVFIAANDDDKIASSHAPGMTENTHMESSIKGRKPLADPKKTDTVLSGRVRKTRLILSSVQKRSKMCRILQHKS